MFLILTLTFSRIIVIAVKELTGSIQDAHISIFQFRTTVTKHHIHLLLQYQLIKNVIRRSCRISIRIVYRGISGIGKEESRLICSSVDSKCFCVSRLCKKSPVYGQGNVAVLFRVGHNIVDAREQHGYMNTGTLDICTSSVTIRIVIEIQQLLRLGKHFQIGVRNFRTAIINGQFHRIFNLQPIENFIAGFLRKIAGHEFRVLNICILKAVRPATYINRTRKTDSGSIRTPTQVHSIIHGPNRRVSININIIGARSQIIHIQLVVCTKLLRADGNNRIMQS